VDLQNEPQWITQTCYSNLYNTECPSKKQSGLNAKAKSFISNKRTTNFISIKFIVIKNLDPGVPNCPCDYRDHVTALAAAKTGARLLFRAPLCSSTTTTEMCAKDRALLQTDGCKCFDTHSKPSESATDSQLLNSAESSTVSGHRKIFVEKLNTTERTHLRQQPLHFLFLQVATTGEQLLNWEPSLKRTKPVSRKNRPTDKDSCSCAQLNIRPWKHSSVDKVALRLVAYPGILFSGGFNKFSWGQRTERTGIWGL